MLPRLLAEYRKYGSRADGTGNAANHRCRSGALVETTKNGKPTVSAIVRSSHHTGLAVPDGG